MAVTTYTATGGKATKAAQLDASVFGLTVTNHELLKAAYMTYTANGRENNAVTKTRGQVRGSTIKPWKQKGTGRARVGSRYNPVWRGGGIVFGPTGEENYSKQLNTKAKRQALRQALSVANEAGKVSVIESLASKEGKTAEMAKLLTTVNATRNVLLVAELKTPELTRASQNLQNVRLVTATYLNVYDILNADTILFSAPALQMTTEWLAKEAK